MSYIGTTKIGGMYLGSTGIAKAYLGADLVFQKGSQPQPQPVFYDSLVFDGIAYIETDIVPAANSSFAVRLGNETLKAGQRLFTAPTSVGYIGAILSPANTTSTRRYFTIYYGTSSALNSSRYLAWTYDTYGFFLTPKRFGWGSTSYTITKGNNNANGGLVIGQSSSLSGQPYTGTMGDFKIYGDDAQNVSSYSGFSSYTPTYTLRPCTYNGEAGLWCVETNTFYGNTAGSGLLSVRNE